VTKISQLSSIGDSLAIGDQFLIRDIDDAGSPNKSVTVSGITRALADGNATAPALAFAADKNTGIYRAGTDSLAVATNGTGRLFVDANGFVGIGAVNTGSTGAQLSTTTTSSTARLIVESTNAAGYTGLRVANGTGHWEMQVDGANQGTSTGTHNLDMGQQLLPVSTTETKSIYRFGNASGLKRKFNLTTVAADRALFSIACGAAGAGNKVALEITVFLTGEKSGVSSDRVFTGKWSVVRGDAGTFTIANVYSAGSAGAATVTASGDNVNINAIFSVVSGGGCFVEIKGLLGTANQGSAENGFTVTMPAI
jgi:hypothetical protein